MRAFGVVFVLFALFAVCQGQDKPRVFVAESSSWEVKGVTGGARPQTAEIIKTFGERCKECVVNMNKDRADYTVVLEHEGGKGLLRNKNKWALFNREGDAIGSGSTRSLGNSVKDACKRLRDDWESHKDRNAEAEHDQ